MISLFKAFAQLVGSVVDFLDYQKKGIAEVAEESDRRRAERDLRYTFDLVERIFTRQRQQNDALNAALLGLIAVDVAFLVLFLDRLCSVGPLSVIGLGLSVVAVIVGIVGDLDDLDVELLVYELAEDPTAAIADRIGILVDYTTTLRGFARRKQLSAAVAGVFVIAAVVYSFSVTFSGVKPLLRSASCAPAREDKPKPNMGFEFPLPKIRVKP